MCWGTAAGVNTQQIYAIFFDASLILIALATTVTLVCWAILYAAPHAPSLEAAVLQRMALITDRHHHYSLRVIEISPSSPMAAGPSLDDATTLTPLPPPRHPRTNPSLVAAAAWANTAIASGGVSVLWCFALLWGVLSFQITVINGCYNVPAQSAGVICQTYAMGSFPLAPMLHAALLCFFMLFVSCKPLLTATSLVLTYVAVCTQSWLLYPVSMSSPPRQLNTAITAACAAALMSTVLLFSFSMAYQRRLSFYRLYSMAVAFDRYDAEVAKLRAAEVCGGGGDWEEAADVAELARSNLWRS